MIAIPAQAAGRQSRAVRAGVAGDSSSAPALHAVCHPESGGLLRRAHCTEPRLPKVRFPTVITLALCPGTSLSPGFLAAELDVSSTSVLTEIALSHGTAASWSCTWRTFRTASWRQSCTGAARWRPHTPPRWSPPCASCSASARCARTCRRAFSRQNAVDSYHPQLDGQPCVLQLLSPPYVQHLHICLPMFRALNDEVCHR